MKNAQTLIFVGGHHNSALAVCQDLIASGTQIIWIGHRHSMWHDSSDSAEYKDVTSQKIPFIDLQAGKFYRTFNPLKLIRIPWGFVQSYVVLLKLKLKLGKNLKGVVSFGGYLAVPVIFSSWLLGIPSITHEQTLTSGWANRFVAKFANKIALSWPQSASFFPHAKTIITGMPLRQEILAVSASSTNPPTIYITGGKQGSHILNTAVFSALPELASKFHVIHQTGHNSQVKDFEAAVAIKNSLPKGLNSRYEFIDYLSGSDLTSTLSKASLVISRAGAHAIYELAYLKKPCVLIPIPWSSHNEQYLNSQLLAEANQAIVLPQEQLNPKSLIDAVNKALNLKPKHVDVPTNGTEELIEIIKHELL